MCLGLYKILIKLFVIIIIVENNNNNNNNNHDDDNNFIIIAVLILLITMLTIKILFTIDSLKRLFVQNTICNYFRLKKHLILILLLLLLVIILIIIEHIILITMLFLFIINSPIKKTIFTIYNSFRLKKALSFD